MTSQLRSGAFIPLFLAFLLAAGGCAELQGGLSPGDILQSVMRPRGTVLDERTVAAGLKEALRVGTDRTVGLTSRTDGFLGNALIHIALPDPYQPMARTLRTLGLGGQVDALETAMNRAAEQAGGEARTVFWDAISGMTLTDAYAILNGGETAATDYFRGRTSESLRGRFRPIVSQKMGEAGLYRAYDQLVTRYNALPFTTPPALNLEEYVTDRGLGGLFTILAQEEQRIRRDPAARTTDLLRKVFSR